MTDLVKIYETMVASLETELANAKLDWLRTEIEGLLEGARTNLADAREAVKTDTTVWQLRRGVFQGC